MSDSVPGVCSVSPIFGPISYNIKYRYNLGEFQFVLIVALPACVFACRVSDYNSTARTLSWCLHTLYYATSEKFGDDTGKCQLRFIVHTPTPLHSLIQIDHAHQSPCWISITLSPLAKVRRNAISFYKVNQTKPCYIVYQTKPCYRVYQTKLWYMVYQTEPCYISLKCRDTD